MERKNMNDKTKFITFGVFLIVFLGTFGAVSGYFYGTRASFFTVPVGMLIGVLYMKYSMSKGWV